jgi:ADP-ribosyl-[dinitrogen reductase] hydrolase
VPNFARHSNKAIVVRCRGGLGRAGTIAARLLVELGVEPREAIGRFRQARHGAVETERQEHYVMSIARNARRRS